MAFHATPQQMATWGSVPQDQRWYTVADAIFISDADYEEGLQSHEHWKESMADQAGTYAKLLHLFGTVPNYDAETQPPDSVNSPGSPGEPASGQKGENDVDQLVQDVMADPVAPRQPDLNLLDDVPYSIRQTRVRASSPSPGSTDAGEPPETKRARTEEASTAFWALSEDEPVVQAELPLSKKDWDRFISKPKEFVMAAMHAKRAEFSMKTASADMKEKMRGAKLTEVNNWLGNRVCEAVLRSELEVFWLLGLWQG